MADGPRRAIGATMAPPALRIALAAAVRSLGTAAAIEHEAEALSRLLAPVYECLQPLLRDAGAEDLVRQDGSLVVYATSVSGCENARVNGDIGLADEALSCDSDVRVRRWCRRARDRQGQAAARWPAAILDGHCARLALDSAGRDDRMTA